MFASVILKAKDILFIGVLKETYLDSVTIYKYYSLI